MKDIKISEELFKRLETHAVGFDTPENVIERLIDFYEDKNSAAGALTSKKDRKLEIVFEPKNVSEFHKQLLVNKVAYLKIYHSNGEIVFRTWQANNITKDSSLIGNLQSGRLRGWRDKGIVKVEVTLEKKD